MSEKTLNKNFKAFANKKLFLLLFLILLVYGGIFLLQKIKKEKPEINVPVVNTSIINTPDVNTLQPVKEPPVVGAHPDYIFVEETPEGKIVKNTKKGISMKIPDGWEANEFIFDKDLEIRKFGPGQVIETELVDGIVIDLYAKENPNSLSIREWVLSNTARSLEELILEKMGDKEIVKTIDKVESGLDEYGNSIFIENAQNIGISFTKDKKVYRFSCIAVDPQYKKYTQKCEKIIKDKIQNEF